LSPSPQNPHEPEFDAFDIGFDFDLPSSGWVVVNHSCVPLYYRPDSINAVAATVAG
jgi:hypothetical protein